MLNQKPSDLGIGDISKKTESGFPGFGIRHTYATFALSLAKGTDIHLLARQMGTSVLMIERHYSHLIARMRASDLVGLR